MAAVDMLDLVVGVVVDNFIQRINRQIPDDKPRDRQKQVAYAVLIARVDRIGDKVKADDREHNSSGEAQKEADSLRGILFCDASDQPAETRPEDAGYKGDYNDPENYRHNCLL